MNTNNSVRLAIVTPLRAKYSETFIHNHIQGLNHVKEVFFEGLLPSKSDGKGELYRYDSAPRLIRGIKKISRMVSGASLSDKRRHAFEKDLKRQKINIVLAEYGTTAAEILPSLKKLKIPLLAHFHGFDAYRYETLNQYKDKYLELFEYSEKIIAVSNHMKNQLISLGAPEGKLEVNIYGVDSNAFEGGELHRENYFVAIGRFVDKKAPYLSILAFKKFLATHPDYHLTMIGDGPLFDSSRMLSKSLGLENKIIFTGALPHSKVQEYLKNARAFIQHSVRPFSGDAEGSPNAILEAMATATPVISTRHTGIPEMVEDGVTGYLVDEMDIEGMAWKMVQVANKPDLAKAIGANAREKVLSEYRLKDSLAKLNAIIRDVIK